MEVDYEKLGLKVGLEIHQQLDTRAKLFCGCPPQLFKEEPAVTFLRRLRPTQSELGQIDPAAYFEFQKGVKILYEADRGSSCLVEMDEEPPHRLNMEAVEIALIAALMMGARPVDEIHVMRKTVIDGSNTTGFQRTCVVAMNGELKVGGKIVPIEHVSLEEDAARKTGEEDGNIIRYRIDRLGVALIEVATSPVVKTPKEAGEVALGVGGLLRATGRVKRGLGTIRQDINISIPKGALIEIKGVQELDLISVVVEYEVQRQLNLIRIGEELKNACMSRKNIHEEFIDVSQVFKQTKCKVIRKALDRNQPVLATLLPGFGGFLKRELMPNFRLGTEMADRARFWGRVGGIFHTDEMPAYGITEQEAKGLRDTVNAHDRDAVVFVADNPENARDALRAVVERAREALEGVPAETRAANPDGTTRYMRPRPGAARMYPETDIPPIQVTDDYLKRIKSLLPEMPEQKLARLKREYRLNEKLAKQILDSEYGGLFETVVKKTDVPPTIVAAFLTETMKALRRDGVDLNKVSDEQMLDVFGQVGSGQMLKEAVQDVVVWLAKHEDKGVGDAVDALGLKGVSEEELKMIVDRAINENRELTSQRSERSFGVLMGIIMKELRGRVNAAHVDRVLKDRLSESLK